jgi:hypothetical protein
MAKIELTQEQKDFRLDSFTLNNQFTYWLVKSGCMWDLKTTNKEYEKLRDELDHASAMESLKRKMFNLAIT